VRLSQEPLYNGVPGRCFDGARYAIADAEAAPPPPTLETQLLAIDVLVETMLLMSETARAEQLNASAAAISAALDNGQGAAAQRMIDRELAALSGFLALVNSAIQTKAPLPWVPEVTRMWFGFAASHRDQLQFPYDVVPGLYQALKFPDYAYRPLQHPESSTIPAPPTPGPETCNLTAPDMPQYNRIQLSFAILGSIGEGAGRFPNHHVCCYIRALSDEPAVAGCGERYFNQTRLNCQPPAWR